MKITRRKFLSAVLSSICFLLIVLALVATFSMQMLGDLRSYVQVSLENIHETTGYRITLEDISWNILGTAGLRIDNLAVYDKNTQSPFFTCRNALVKFDIIPLFSAHVKISRIALNEPCLSLYQDEAGELQLPDLGNPLDGESLKSIEAFPDFSLSLKKLFINSGSLHFLNLHRDRKLSLQDIKLQIERDRRTGSFAIALQARQDGAENSSIGFTGAFQGIDARGRPERLTGSGELTAASAQPLQLLRFFNETFDNASFCPRFNGKINLKLEPDWQFLLSGSINSDNATVPLPGGKHMTLGPAGLLFQGRADSSLVLLDSFTLALSGAGEIYGKCSITRLNQNSPYLELKCATGALSVPALVRIAGRSKLMPEQARSIASGITDGVLEIQEAHILTELDPARVQRGAKMNARVQLRNLEMGITERLPPLKIPQADIRLFDNETIIASVAARWQGTDNHTLQAEVRNVFHEPGMTVLADSRLSAAGTELFLKALAPELSSNLTVSSGILRAKACLTIGRQAHMTASVDAQDAGLLLSGIEKPEGQPLSMHINADFAPGMHAVALPLSVRAEIGTEAAVEAKVTGLSPLTCSGTYDAREFQLSRLQLPDLKGLMDIGGRLSGAGKWKFPARGAFPLEGSISLTDFYLGAVETGKLLVGGSIQGKFTPEAFLVSSCQAAMGETRGSLNGRLTEILPTRGKLFIVADLFDIDDFVTVIDYFIWVREQIKLRAPAALNPTKPEQQKNENPLLLTDLEMPLTLNRLNLWNWDFDNGTCHWSFKKGVMHFNDIHLYGGGGPIDGTVIFDMSQLPARTLTLSPKKSRSEFLWVVPGLRKNKTITGTMDMSGYFSSTFSQKEELGRNMGGKFHVRVTDGKLQKLTALSKVLELMNIGNLFSFVSGDLLSTGMPYDSITADFTVDHAVMETKNLQLKGPAMNLSAVGTINMLNERLDLVIGAQVLEAFGKIIGVIPIAGSIVTGPDKTITLAYFKITGTYLDSSVMPMPVKSMSEPILKVMNSLLYFPRKLFRKAESDNQTLSKNK